MATFKIRIRGRRSDGLYPVYLRITHNRQVGYIKTDKCVDVKNIKKGEVVDPNILAYCVKEILRYNEALNTVDLSCLTASEVVILLKTLDNEISFSAYARSYVRRMIVEWKMERNAKNYLLALRSLELFTDRNNILCSNLTEKIIRDWISDLEKHYHRATQCPFDASQQSIHHRKGTLYNLLAQTSYCLFYLYLGVTSVTSNHE